MQGISTGGRCHFRLYLKMQCRPCVEVVLAFVWKVNFTLWRHWHGSSFQASVYWTVPLSCGWWLEALLFVEIKASFSQLIIKGSRALLYIYMFLRALLLHALSLSYWWYYVILIAIHSLHFSLSVCGPVTQTKGRCDTEGIRDQQGLEAL